MRFHCIQAPVYGKWHTGTTYKGKIGRDPQSLEPAMIIRDQKNERKSFSLDPENPYFFGRFFENVTNQKNLPN